MTTNNSKYQLGDILLCGKHIGVVGYIGKLHHSHYQSFQKSSSGQNELIQESSIWIGLRLAESPEHSHAIPFRPPKTLHNSPQVRPKQKAIQFETLFNIPIREYFDASFGLLIPQSYIYKKINAYQLLIKLTNVFHEMKRISRKNKHLKKIIRKQKELLRNSANNKSHKSQEIKAETKNNLESIIFDEQTGNSYYQSFTSMTSFQAMSTVIPSPKANTHHSNNNNNNNNNNVHTNANANANANEKTNTGANPNENENAILRTNNNNNNHSNVMAKPATKYHITIETVADVDGNQSNHSNTSRHSISLSMNATNHKSDDSFSDRMIEEEEEEHVHVPDPDPDQEQEKKEHNDDVQKNEHPQNKEESQDTTLDNLNTDPKNNNVNTNLDPILEESTTTTVIKKNINTNMNTASAHIRRFSAPWDNKTLADENIDNFGTNYDKFNNPYWKNNGSPMIDQNAVLALSQIDSNTLPFLKNDPRISYLYSMSKLQQEKLEHQHQHHHMAVEVIENHNQNNNDPNFNNNTNNAGDADNARGRSVSNTSKKRARSMSLCTVPMHHYTFDEDMELPDLP